MQKTHKIKTTRLAQKGKMPQKPIINRKKQSVRTTAKRNAAMKMFSPELKQLHKSQAAEAENKHDYDYLRGEIANRLLARLGAIKLPFENAVILGYDQGGLAEAIVQRHVQQKLNPFEAKEVKQSFMMEAPPSLDPNDPSGQEAPLDPAEVADVEEHFRRYAIPGLKHLTIVDPNLKRLIGAQKPLVEALSSLPNKDQFTIDILPSALPQLPLVSIEKPNDPIDNNTHPHRPAHITHATDQTTSATIVKEIAPNSAQLVTTSLNLHWENDLPKVFQNAYTTLAPNGALIGAMIGGETLRELRSALTLAEMERAGGVTHHVSPFAFTKDIGDLMSKAGFEMISVDIDTVKIPYPDMFTLIEHIRGMGESHAPWLGWESEMQQQTKGQGGSLDDDSSLPTKRPESSPPMSKDTWIAANAIYQTLYKDMTNDAPKDWLVTTVDVIMFIGWKGHDSIAKPAKRGSATAKFGQVIPGATGTGGTGGGSCSKHNSGDNNATQTQTSSGSSSGSGGIKTTRTTPQQPQQEEAPAYQPTPEQESTFASFFKKFDLFGSSGDKNTDDKTQKH